MLSFTGCILVATTFILKLPPGVQRGTAIGASDGVLEMPKAFHEVRDPIHTFVRFDSAERDVINSPPLQRLRHIQQLGMSHLVYPGATHKRFEHSLGVMELAARVFDVVTDRRNVPAEITGVDLGNDDQVRYWRRVLRMAALCHDIGHLPFSHSAEKELLPQGWNH